VVVDDVVARQRPRIRFVSIDVHSGSVEHRADARIVLEVEGEPRSAEADGDGPVHAAFRAIRAAVPHRANLSQFSVTAEGPGPDAVAMARVRLEEHGRIVEGCGEDTDTIIAATKAFVHALNKLASKTEQAVHVSPAFLTA
jgi:2-isopropylmalate synthase